MPKIGVFWFYEGAVIGRAVDSAEGEEGVPGLIDSPDNHADLWEEKILSLHPKLSGQEYYEVPRGRVLWDNNHDRSIVYLDTRLLNPEIKGLIAQFFDLHVEYAFWRTDSHYTTDDKGQDRLFSE